MAAFGRSLSHAPQNHAQNRPYNRKQVACRLCDRALNSTQALISHIESHIVRGDIAPLRQNQQHPYNNQPMMIQPNHQFFFPNPNPGPRLAPPPPPQRPVFLPISAGPTAQAVQRPVPSRGPNLSLTLGGGAAGGAHSVKVNLSQPRVSPDPAAKSGSGKLVKRPRRSPPAVAGSGDCTRPLLSRLDHPIPKVVDLDVENEDGLDLTLKL